MKWIFTAKKRVQRYDLDSALRELPCINWPMNKYKPEPGDIVYLYESHPESYIRYKCVVREIEVNDHKYDESRYGGHYKHEPEHERAMSISLEYEFNKPVDLKTLSKHGLSAKRISVTSSQRKPEVFAFLSEYEEMDRMDEIEPSDLKDQLTEKNLRGKERTASILQRVNQADFRDLLIKRYGSCTLCGNDEVTVLYASHIKPWSESNDIEKLDPDNGFLLCPCHDRAFDLGLISFDDNGMILISKKLTPRNQHLMNISSDQKVKLNKGNKLYLAYHRKHIFKG